MGGGVVLGAEGTVSGDASDAQSGVPVSAPTASAASTSATGVSGGRPLLSADLLLKEHGDGGRNIIHMAVAMCAPTSNK